MISCYGSGCGISWTVLIMIMLMCAGCFFMILRMRGKGNNMDCCTKNRSGTDGKREQPQINK